MSRHFLFLVITLLSYIAHNKESYFAFTLPEGLPESHQNAEKKRTDNISTPITAEERDKPKEAFKINGHSSNVDPTKVLTNSSVIVNEMQQNITTQISVLPTIDNDFNRTIDSPRWLSNINSGALQRTGLVVLGIMSVLLFFFLIHAIRVRQKRSKSRKYGVIASTASDVEMEPLERGGAEDDEEETTLFDAQHKFRLK